MSGIKKDPNINLNMMFSEEGTILLDSSGGAISDDAGFYGLTVITEAVITLTDFEYDDSSSGIENYTLPAGLFLPLKFKGITVTSGLIAVYKNQI